MDLFERRRSSGLVALCLIALLAASSQLVPTASASTISAALTNAIKSDLNNLHFPPPTSSPFVQAAASAAAAAALGGLDTLVSGGAPRTTSPGPPISVEKLRFGVTSAHGSSPSTSVKIATSLDLHKITTPSPVSSGGSLHKLHKHLNKKLSDADKLHKFDLFIDPVCEQIAKLTERQLNKVSAQLKQFSQLTNQALGKCLSEHGFNMNLAAVVVPSSFIRDNLANFCTARSADNIPYKQFIDCASRTWLPAIDEEIDRILKARVRSNKSTSTKEEKSSSLTHAEMSLIDDIVAHLHEEQVQEIANELVSEQQQLIGGSSSRPSSATLSSHQNSGKLNLSNSADGGGGALVHVQVRPQQSRLQFSSSQQQQQQNNNNRLNNLAAIHIVSAQTTVPPQQTTAQPAKLLSASVGGLVTINHSSSTLDVASKGHNSVLNANSQHSNQAGRQMILNYVTTSTMAPRLQIIKQSSLGELLNKVEQQTAFKSPITIVDFTTKNNSTNNFKAALGAAISAASTSSAQPATRAPTIVHFVSGNAIPQTTTPKQQFEIVIKQAATGPPVTIRQTTTHAPTIDVVVKSNQNSSNSQGANNHVATISIHSNSNKQQSVQVNPSVAVKTTLAPQSISVVAPSVLPTQTTTTTTVVKSPVDAIGNNLPRVAATPSATVKLGAPAQPIDSAAAQTLSAGATVAAPAQGNSASSASVSASPTVIPTISPLANMLLGSIDVTTTVKPVQTAAQAASGSAATSSSASLPSIQPTASAASASSAAFGSTGSAGAVGAQVSAQSQVPVPTTVAPVESVIPSPQAAALSAQGSGSQPAKEVASSSNAAGASSNGNGNIVQPATQAPAVGNATLANGNKAIPQASPQGAGASGAAANSVAINKPVVGSIESATLKNVDKALEIMSKSDQKDGMTIVQSGNNSSTSTSMLMVTNVSSTTTTTTTTPKPSSEQATIIKIIDLSQLGIKVASTSSRPALKLDMVSEKGEKLTMTSIDDKTAERATTTTTTAKPASATIEIKTSPEKKDDSSNHELDDKLGGADVHEVIVVGEHVEGDDVSHDYEDHSDHHKDESHSETSSEVSHDEAHHIVAKLSTKQLAKAMTSSNSSSSANKDEHADHEHLLEGLSIGDVVHVEA